MKHGADPNAIAFWTVADAEPREAETPLSPLLNGLFINGRKLSWEERRATAEVLLEHGADINVSRSIHGYSCDIPLLSRAPEGDAPWQWALNHGMNMKQSNFTAFICHPSARALVERVLREKLVDINAVDGGETVLQKMLEMLRHNYFGDLTVEEWEARLDMLLAAGADPNLVVGKGDLQYAEYRKWDESGTSHVKQFYPKPEYINPACSDEKGFLDIEWEFIDAGVEDANVRKYIRECVAKDGVPNRI